MKFKRQKPTNAKYRHDLQQKPVTADEIAEEIRQRIAPLVATLKDTEESAEVIEPSPEQTADDTDDTNPLPVEEPSVDAQVATKER